MPSSPRRSSPRTPWHVYFAELLAELGGPAFVVETEVELLRRPARADVVVVRRQGRAGPQPSRGLWRLWSWIDAVALVEFKSHKEPLRRGDVAHWLSLCYMLCAARRRRGELAPVQGVLAVVCRTPTLFSETAALGATLRDEGGGYLTFDIGPMAAKVVVLDEVSAAEREPLLGLFSGSTLEEPRVQRWLVEHFGKVISVMGTKVTETYKDLLEFLATHVPPKELVAMVSPERLLASIDPEQRLAGLRPEERLAGLQPEQRLAGLRPEQRLAGLRPEEIRQALDALPAATRRSISEARPRPRVGKKKAAATRTRRKG
jgi:hypothetical protein